MKKIAYVIIDEPIKKCGNLNKNLLFKTNNFMKFRKYIEEKGLVN